MNSEKWYIEGNKDKKSAIIGNTPSKIEKKNISSKKSIVTIKKDESSIDKEIEEINQKKSFPSTATSSSIPSVPLVPLSNEEWDPDWYRVFVGNLGPEVTDSLLTSGFNHYTSVVKSKVIREKGGKSKGFGFVAFKEGKDYLRAIKEMEGKFIGTKPINIRKSVYNKNKY